MPARPFWNTPILAMLFLLSSISNGIAAILLLRAILESYRGPGERVQRLRQSDYVLSATDVLLIGFELLVIFLFLMYAHLTIGNVKEAVSVVLPGGSLAPMFWFGVIVVGLLIPALIELYYVIPRLLHGRQFRSPRVVDIVVTVTVIFGGFLLRYVVVIAGQITAPSGI